MVEWLETPATVAALGIAVTAVAVLLVVGVAVALGMWAVCGRSTRADRALVVMKELRLLVAAMRSGTTGEQ